MQSEKVKEIKKALECMSGVCKDATTRVCWNCPIGKKFNDETACKEALTLINELVSENERLLEQRNKTYIIWVKNTEKLKDRIAELEKKNEILQGTKNRITFDERVAIGNKALNEVKAVVLPKFAERLKEISCEMCLKEQLHRCTNEVLKDFINGGK